MLKGSFVIFKGVHHSRRLIRQFAPDLVIGFGSYFTLPVLIAALLEKVPIVLHEQNVAPGKVNHIFSSFACRTAITFSSSMKFLNKRARHRAVEVLFPLRKRTSCREESWDYFGLKPGRLTFLVFGGSQGAARLNMLFLEAISTFPDVQAIHFTGKEETVDEIKKSYSALHIPACVRAFEKNIDRAMQIADCAITRAGAATIAELIEHELPAVLIPYPHATKNHQEINARHFVSLVKGGTLYKENSSEPLAPCIQRHLSQLPMLKKQIAAYKNQRGAKPLASLIEDLLNGKS